MALKIEKKQPVAVVTAESKGVPASMEELPYGDPIMVKKDETFANVGMKVGMTKNLGNYESVRIDVSLYVPCVNDADVINDTFELVNTWVDIKMAEILQEYEDSL